MSGRTRKLNTRLFNEEYDTNTPRHLRPEQREDQLADIAREIRTIERVIQDTEGAASPQVRDYKTDRSRRVPVYATEGVRGRQLQLPRPNLSSLKDRLSKSAELRPTIKDLRKKSNLEDIARNAAQGLWDDSSDEDEMPLVVSKAGQCVESKLDLVFVVDSSGSIRDANPSDGSFDNYNLLKEFMTGVVDRVWVDADTTRVGVVIFSQRVINVFYLNTYSNKDDINAAILGMEYLGSHTNTAGGIRAMQTEQFTAGSGHRADARKVAIVITDGVSTIDSNQTIPNAISARSDNIRIYSVGITVSVDELELKGISSLPQVENENYFMSPDFTTLSTIFETLVGIRQCVATTTTTTAAPTASPCDDSIIDLVFVLDSSGSIRDNNPADASYDNYNLILLFVLDIVSLLNISPTQARVGLVIFSNRGRSVFHLNDYDNYIHLADAIKSVEYIGGDTNTSGGLKIMLNESFTSANGDRSNVPNVAIVITDGVSTIDKAQTIPTAELAHQAGIQIYSVGITDQIQETELRRISSAPQLLNQNYFLSTDFVTLSGVVNRLVAVACPTSQNITGSCIQGQNDLVFLLDSSGSICGDSGNVGSSGCPNYQLLLSFVSNIVSALSFQNNDTRVGLVLYGNDAENIFFLNAYKSQFEMISAIGALGFKGGNTNTSGAIRLMMDTQFQAQAGDRPSANNIAIVITDGESTYDADRTIPDAQVARAAGVQIYAVGISDAVNVNELEQISSMPQELNRNYYLAADFSTLNELVNVLVSKDCHRVSVTTTTAYPTTTEEPETDMTLAYILILAAVVIFLAILRVSVFCCRRAVYQMLDDDRELLYKQ